MLSKTMQVMIVEREFICAECGKRSDNVLDFQFIGGESATFSDWFGSGGLPYNTGQNYCNDCAEKRLRLKTSESADII